MSRLMSVAFTEDAVVERRKTVTRRKGWAMAKVGDHLTLCRKVMGRKPDEPLVRIAEVEILEVRRERLGQLLIDPAYGAAEMVLEGFPGMHPSDFIRTYFTDAQGIDPTAEITRIEWRYL